MTGCPSNGAPPKLRSSEEFKQIIIDRASKHEENFIGIEEYVPDEQDEHQVSFVGNGLTDEYHHLRIVDEHSREVLADGQIGQVWFTGPSVSPGYWLLDEVSKQAFGNRLAQDDGRNYLQTGDLGFIVDKQLYVTGRSKDMLILKGKNYYPQDIEATVKYCHQHIHPGFTAAFEVDERLVIVTEVHRGALKALDPKALVQQIGRSVYQNHDVSVDDVVLLAPYKIPMTSSGKIRRRQTKKLYQANRLSSLYQQVSSDEQVAPSTDEENVIHGIWAQVLAAESICVTRGFFELGGDSISAMEIAAKVSQHYGDLKLDENALLQCVSIREMAQFVTIQVMKNAKAATNTVGAIRI